jgi:uncharacterized protein (TIGR02757 family)
MGQSLDVLMMKSSAPKRRATPRALGPLLDRLREEFDPRHISPDPIEIVHQYADPGDQEVVALFAAVLAYGNVRQILRSVRAFLVPLGARPRDAVREMDEKEAIREFQGFRHRFNSGMDAARLVLAVGGVIREHGSLESLFLQGHSTVDRDVGPALDAFALRLRSMSCPAVERREKRLGLVSRASFFFPCPSDGSACKRLNLFLRWMVRGPDGVDLGLWRCGIRPAQLVIPLDTHVWRICRQIGLTARRSPDWRAALDITQALREFAPDDPVRYDFAISRLGILRRCGARASLRHCGQCALKGFCVEESETRGAAIPRRRRD